jgi:hypothetical protein
MGGLKLDNRQNQKTDDVAQGGKVHEISAYEAATRPGKIEENIDPTADVIEYVHDVKIEKPLKE